MFEKLRYRVGLAYARFHFRSESQQPLRWTGAISSARRALLLLPEAPTDPQALRSTVEYFLRTFTPANLLIVSRVDVSTQLFLDRRAQLQTFAPTDLNAWFLPQDELTRRVKKSTFDVAVDLNLDLALPSAYLCRASEARIRVGFAKPYGDTFYNFQVQPRRITNFGSAATYLINCLQMF
jgi:hypothetical protein